MRTVTPHRLFLALVSTLGSGRVESFADLQTRFGGSSGGCWSRRLASPRSAWLQGLAIAAGMIRLFSASVPILPDFGVRPFVIGAGIVVVATAVATLWPLRGAARIEPAQALRTE